MKFNRAAHFPQFLAATLVALAWVGSSEAKEKNPTSKLYIANLDGAADIDTGDRIESLNEKSVHNAQGTVIETDSKGSNAMVFSNGMGVYLIPDSRMEVKKFRQEPFVPNRTDLDVEPSISQTAMGVSHGAVGICPPRLVAGSSMVFSTPQGSVSVRSGNVVIETDEGETRISLIEGDVTVRGGENDSGGTPLQPGQQAVITRTPDGSSTVSLRPIPAPDRPKLEEWSAQACMARRTVYFDVDDSKSQDAGDNFSGPSVFNRESESGDKSRFGSNTRSNTDGDTADVLVVVQLVPTDPPGTTAGRSTGGGAGPLPESPSTL